MHIQLDVQNHLGICEKAPLPLHMVIHHMQESDLVWNRSEQALEKREGDF